MRFHYIQILRFVAAAGVLVYHGQHYATQRFGSGRLSPWFDARFAWGVELFFAISGFVIAHSLERSTPARFALHRVLRIYPAYVLAFAAAIIGRFALGGELPESAAIARGLSLLPVCCAAYPLGVEWSLVYEIVFYLLLGALAFLPWHGAREWAVLAWAVAIGAVASWGVFDATAFLPGWRRILLSAFNLPFIAGVLGYAWFRRSDRLPLAPLLLAVPLALVIGDRLQATAARLAMLALGFGALVLAAAELSRRRDASSRNMLVRFGDWSYGLYLIHVPVVLAVTLAFPKTLQQADFAFVAATSCALVLGLAFGAADMALYRHNKRWLNERVGPAGFEPATKGL